MGDRRIGLAVSPGNLRTAVPAGYIERTKLKEDVQRVLEEATSRGASEIVVGIPYSLDGSAGPQAKKTLRFVNVLRQHTSLPVTRVSEQYSTAEASRRMGQARKIGDLDKGDIDASAATVILQDYLDQTARGDSS